MTATISKSGPFERLVRFHVPDDRIAEAKKAVARRLSREVKIKGFRPGKAPLPIVEATVGPDRVRREAIDDLLPSVLSEILEEEEIEPAINPELSSLDDVEDGVEVEVKVTLWPTIELPKYKNRNVEVTNPAVTEDDLNTQVTRMLEQFATVEEVDRPADEGDFVSIDVEAEKDDEPVEEARAFDLLYEVGSGLFVEGMDEKVSGSSTGDQVEFEAPLPEGFGDRAGEIVTFRIKVNEVKQRVLPELDDEWVDENTEFDTVAELTEELRARLSDAKLRAVAQEFAERALATLREQVDVVLPESLVRAEMDDQLHTFLHRLEEADVTLEDYYQLTGITREKFLDDLRQQAELSLLNRLVLGAVADAEGIKVTEEDVTNAVQAFASRSDDPVAYLKAFQQSGQELAVAGDILRNRAMTAILSSANPVDEDGNPVDLSVKEVEAEVVEADIVEGEVVEGEVLAEAVEEEE